MAPPTSVQPGWLSPEPVSSGEAFKPVLRGGGRGKQSAGEDGLRCKREEPGSPLRTFEPSLLPGRRGTRQSPVLPRATWEAGALFISFPLSAGIAACLITWASM